MKRVRALTALSITGVVVAGGVAAAVNTQVLSAATASAPSSNDSLRAAEEVVDPAKVTPEQLGEAAEVTARQSAQAQADDDEVTSRSDSTSAGSYRAPVASVSATRPAKQTGSADANDDRLRPVSPSPEPSDSDHHGGPSSDPDDEDSASPSASDDSLDPTPSQTPPTQPAPSGSGTESETAEPTP